jgi:hypothetical protein
MNARTVVLALVHQRLFGSSERCLTAPTHTGITQSLPASGDPMTLFTRRIFSKSKFTRPIALGAAALALAGGAYGIVSATSSGGTAAASVKVIPFNRGDPSPAKIVGQVPPGWTAGSGKLVTGTAAAKATAAAIAAYPGGSVDRVVQVGGGDYNVHIVGVNWPHHVFVNSSFQVIGAE